VALITQDDDADCLWCTQVGVDACLTKPVGGPQLLEAVEALIHAADAPTATDTGPVAPVPVLDAEQAARSVSGDSELLKEIVALFMQDSAEFLAKIRQAVDACSPENLERAAHSLKGSVGNFGAAPAFDAAARLETIGRDGQMDQAPSAMAALAKEMDRLTPALKALVQEDDG